MTEEKVKIDLACGVNKKPGFLGVDLSSPQADITWDLEETPWGFEEDSVDEIYCSHYIEHVKDLIGFMNEVYRILKVGGTARFISPYYTSIRAWQDPTHVRAISEAMYLYFNKQWRERNFLSHYRIKANFKIVKLEYDFNEGYDYSNRFEILHYWNVIKDIDCTLEKLCL